MIVYPAIDLRQGRCVRLRQGDAQAATVFADDPVDAAKRWAEEGAEWLHLVNLDGALGESGAANLAALERVLSAVSLPVQFGGGMRSLADIERILEIGAQRVILGTVAVREPSVVQQALTKYGSERICVGIDARDGRVAINGWIETSKVTAATLAQAMFEAGVRHTVYTDVSRDGMLSGVNVGATRELARASGLQVIASGGVASIDDIRAVKACESDGVSGVIVGMALYTGALDLQKALRVAKGSITC